MVRVIFNTVLIGFACIVLRCADYPEPLLCKDTLGISKSLSDIMKKKYGLFVASDSKISSTNDFFNCTLLLFGETEGHLEDHIATLGMKETHNLLFKEVVFIDSSTEVEVNAPCLVRIDTLIWADGQELPRVRNTYSYYSDLYKIFEQSLNSSNCVYVMTKSDSKHFSDKLKELIVK